MIKIPYSALELRCALLGLDGEKFSEEKMKELEVELKELFCPPEEIKDKNKKVAEYHGISVETLVNSPNYKVLCQEYVEDIICQFIKKIIEKFDITDKEAWALTAFGLGSLG